MQVIRSNYTVGISHDGLVRNLPHGSLETAEQYGERALVGRLKIVYSHALCLAIVRSEREWLPFFILGTIKEYNAENPALKPS